MRRHRRLVVRGLLVLAGLTAIDVAAYRLIAWLPRMEPDAAGWTYYALQSAAGLVAALLAILLATRSTLPPSTGYFATFLGSFALVSADEGHFRGLWWIAWTLGVRFDYLFAASLLNAALFSVGAGAALRWTLRFPAPLRPADLHEAYPRRWRPVARVHAWLVRGSRPWWVFGGAGVALLAASEVGGGVPSARIAIMFAVGVSTALFATQHVRVNLARGDPGVRRRSRWILQAALTLSVLLSLALLVEIPVHFGSDPAGPVAEWLHAILLPSALLSFVLLLAVALLYRGALDPALALRKTALYGATGVLFTAVFVTLEEVAASALARRIALPDWIGGVGAGVVVALVFTPLKERLEGRRSGASDE